MDTRYYGSTRRLTWWYTKAYSSSLLLAGFLMCQLRLHQCMVGLPNTPRSVQGSLRPNIALRVFNKNTLLQHTSVKSTMGRSSVFRWNNLPRSVFNTVTRCKPLVLCDRLCAHCSDHVLVNRMGTDTASRQMAYQEVLGTLQAVGLDLAREAVCTTPTMHQSVNRTIADTTSPKWLVFRTLKTGEWSHKLWLLSWFMH